MNLNITGVAGDFPAFRVAAVVARGLAIPPDRPRELAEIIAEREAACRARWGGTELSAIPGIAVWRAAYRAFGIKKTSYRCSVERLVKNVLAERPLPAINAFVDAYNAVSLAHVMPLGADDLAFVAGDVAFRRSQPSDTFLDMAGGEEGEGSGPVSDPPKEGEVVYADAEKVLCRRWNWRQDARSLVTPATTAAIVTVQTNGEGDLEAAVADLRDLIGRFCGGSVTVAIADQAHVVAEISHS
ncbi:MAG TPA: phenylalanine--tRNA ligase beta subunit-related protein [Bauldia sp.]|nr:phenylalanine--tRNA ligase beta subunit-related protein [Bauldia sp.]